MKQYARNVCIFVNIKIIIIKKYPNDFICIIIKKKKEKIDRVNEKGCADLFCGKRIIYNNLK